MSSNIDKISEDIKNEVNKLDVEEDFDINELIDPQNVEKMLKQNREVKKEAKKKAGKRGKSTDRFTVRKSKKKQKNYKKLQKKR